MRKGAHDAKRLVAERLVRHDGDVAQIDAGGGQIVTRDGEKVAVSRTADGSLHAVSPVCTHLRCTVTWNEAEHSWDCPCHGSRFAPTGAVLNAPRPGLSQTRAA